MRQRKMKQQKMKQRKSKQSKSLAKILTLGIAAATVVSSMSVPGGLLAPETVYADDNTGAAESGDQGTARKRKANRNRLCKAKSLYLRISGKKRLLHHQLLPG